MKLEESLEFLKGYIHRCLHNHLDDYTAPDGLDLHKHTIEVICEKLHHAIDHIIIDHCESNAHDSD